MDRKQHIIILLLFIVVLFEQCSPRSGRSLLTFFFDGVPVKDTCDLLLSASVANPADSLTPLADENAIVVAQGIVHYPYQERECSSCHNERSLGHMVEPEPDLCYLCHEDLGESFKYLHGPVAGGYCTSCHDPHQSENKKLLRFKGQALCFYCHDQARLLKTEMHVDLDGMACSDCHHPHGGEDRFILH